MEMRRTVCQHQQQKLWVLVTSYAEDHGRVYPKVGPNENAGIFVARLIEAGYIRPADLAPLLVCPASPFADEIRAGRLTFRLPNARGNTSDDTRPTGEGDGQDVALL